MASIDGTTSNDTLTGDSSSNIIYGYRGDDYLDGKAGDDVFYGGDGLDTLIGGSGTDYFVVKTSGPFRADYTVNSIFTGNQDQITDFVRGEDKIDVSNLGVSNFAALTSLADTETPFIFQNSVGETVVRFYYQGYENSVTLQGVSSLDAGDFFTYSQLGDRNSITLPVGTFGADDLFANGDNPNLRGYSGDDRLIGDSGSNTLDGDDGADTLVGGGGIDYYVLKTIGPIRPDGGDFAFSQNQDVVVDFDITQDQIDLSTLGVTQNSFDLFRRYFILEQDDNAKVQVLRNNRENSIQLQGIAPEQLSQSNFFFSSSTDNTSIEGSNFSDDLFGTAGNNTIEGANGDDRLLGQEGSDRLEAGNGSDTLAGGAGNDTLDGGEDIDLVVYSGTRSDYQIDLSTNNSITVTDSVGDRDGVDVLTNVENIRFLGDSRVFSLGRIAGIAGSNREPTFFEGNESYINTDRDLYRPNENTATVSGWIKDLDNISNTNTQFDYIDVWLAYPNGEWEELEDITDFSIYSENSNWAEFEFDLDLSTKPYGEYGVWLQGYDIDGTTTEPLTVGFAYGNPPEQLSYRVGRDSQTYTRTETLQLKDGWVYDADGTANISRIDFWVSDGSNWYDIADVTSFDAWSSDNNWAQFDYQIELSEYTPGNYTLWGQTFDDSGLRSNVVTAMFTVEDSGTV